MKFLIAVAFVMAGFGSCSKTQAITVPAAMNVSGQGSDYIFVYRGNNPNEFDTLVAQGLNNLRGWSATCTSSQCLGTTYIIDHATLPSSDYLYLYTANADGTSAQPDSGRFYSFSSPTPPPPPLCCGGTAGGAITTDVNFFNGINAFMNRTTGDAQIYVEQIGSNNNITIDQSGTINNKVKYNGNGNDNMITIQQSSTNTTALNYTDLTVNGNNNQVNITQQSTGGFKGINAKVHDNNNSLAIQQKDNGNHVVEVNLSGGNKNVDVLQEGSGNQTARIGLTGMPVDLSLSQSGSTSQTYSIQFNCATAGGCPKIVVQQGR
jgi:hypothetical protein